MGEKPGGGARHPHVCISSFSPQLIISHDSRWNIWLSGRLFRPHNLLLGLCSNWRRTSLDFPEQTSLQAFSSLDSNSGRQGKSHDPEKRDIAFASQESCSRGGSDHPSPGSKTRRVVLHLSRFITHLQHPSFSRETTRFVRAVISMNDLFAHQCIHQLSVLCVRR